MASPFDNLTKYVTKELEENHIPPDAKYAIVGGVDNNGVKVVGVVKINNTDKFNLSVAGMWEHDWDGDDTVGGKLIFVGK